MNSKFLRYGLSLLLVLLHSIITPAAQENHTEFEPVPPSDPPFLAMDQSWVDSVMETLSLDERIAQMIMVYGYSNMGAEHQKAVLRQVRKHKIGGILFFQGKAREQARLTNIYQDASQVPLLIAIDGENGLGMRLENTLSYPAGMTLGAISDNSLIYRLGREMGQQFRRLGVHMNLAPVADINKRRNNPVIGSRSFGEGRKNVADKVVAYMQGMQDEGVLVSAKHFPGHGDTDTDSHRALPVIPHDKRRLDSLELFPFRAAIDKGLTGIMLAHLRVPELDARENRASTLSRPTITGLLKDEMGFKGLIITDALNMKGLSSFKEPGLREVEAVRAGNDILLMPVDVGQAISAIKKAVRQGQVIEEEVNLSCRKILQAKYWAGIHHKERIGMSFLHEDLNSAKYKSLYRKLVEHSLVLVKNKEGCIPLSQLENIRLATITISQGSAAEPLRTTDLYLKGKHFTLDSRADGPSRMDMLPELKNYNTLIVNVLNTSSRASRGYGISEGTLNFLEELDPQASVILNVAGMPYSLSRFRDLDLFDAVVLSYRDDPLYQDLALQAIFGGATFSGKLPVTAGPQATAGEGFDTGPATRLGYASPLDVGMHPDSLQKMDAIITRALRKKAMPGCQVLVARRGKVVWHKTYGHRTYRRKIPVQTEDIYDLASITKMASITAALMRLKDQGKFHEDSLMGAYDPVPDSSNKAGLLAADVLAHQSGMIAWIPFYYETLEPLDTSQALVSSRYSRIHPLKIAERTYFNRHVRYRDSVYQKVFSPLYPYQVARDLYMNKNWKDTLYRRVYDSELKSGEYRYSGLGFYMFQQIIEDAADTLLYPFVWHNFYNPLGAHSMGYKPLDRFSQEQIIPTENDNYFRHQLLHGHVHDMGAAMLGGISGNAGLFGNANDLAKMMQMFLNGGNYGRRRYLQKATVDLYTSRYNTSEQEKNHRGFGFNKPVTWEEDAGPACNGASPLSYGHSGFTGTLAWADPEYELVYIFLSNRVYPDMGNKRFIDMNVRTKVQQVVYDALLP